MKPFLGTLNSLVSCVIDINLSDKNIKVISRDHHVTNFDYVNISIYVRKLNFCYSLLLGSPLYKSIEPFLWCGLNEIYIKCVMISLPSNLQ